MSYTIGDMLHDAGFEGDYQATERLEAQLRERFTENLSNLAYEEAEVWYQEHIASAVNPERVPEYAQGVYNGMLKAARRMREGFPC